MIIESDTSILIAAELSTIIQRLPARSTSVRAPLSPAHMPIPFPAPASVSPAHTCASTPHDRPVRAPACARSLKVPEHLLFEGRAARPAAAASSIDAAAQSGCRQGRRPRPGRAGSRSEIGRRLDPRRPVSVRAALAAPHGQRALGGRSRRQPTRALATACTFITLSCARV